MPPHPLTNFEIQKYYQNKSKFNSVYLKNYLRKIWTYIINLDEYESIGCHVIALYVNSDNVTYFHGFGVEYIPKEIKTFIRKISQQIFIEYKQMIQQCGDTFVFYLFILCKHMWRLFKK